MKCTTLVVIWNFRQIRQIGWGREFNSGISSLTILKHLHSVSAKEVWLRMFRMGFILVVCDDVYVLLKALKFHHNRVE